MPRTKNYGSTPYKKANRSKTLTTVRNIRNAEQLLEVIKHAEVEHNCLYKAGNIYTQNLKTPEPPKKGGRTTRTNCRLATLKHRGTQEPMASLEYRLSHIYHFKRLIISCLSGWQDMCTEHQSKSPPPPGRKPTTPPPPPPEGKSSLRQVRQMRLRQVRQMFISANQEYSPSTHHASIA